MKQQTFSTDENVKPRPVFLHPRWQWAGSTVFLLLYVGYWLWRLFRYGRRLWRQPKLASRQVQIQRLPDSVIEAEAAAIAQSNVRSGLEMRTLLNGEQKLILCAGARNFREPWARDFGFACYGLMAMGETTAAKEGLDVFLHYQKHSGQFPVKVHSTNILDRVLHALLWREQPITAPLRPKYKTAHNTISLDGNALLVTAVLHYAKQQPDKSFLQQWWPALLRAMAWLAEHERGDQQLLHQRAFADWADSIARQGHILYTNVLYWKAVTEMARAAQTMSQIDTAGHFETRAQQLRKAINVHFWEDDLGYFVTSKRFRNLSSAGNLLAVAWELATPVQAHSILDKMDAFQMADPVPTQVVNLPYPEKVVGLENRLAGIPEYHTSAAWLWLGAWHVIALVRTGRLEQANELFRRISEVIVRDGIVHEVYGQNGRFLSTRWYTSEAPLTWNAGMVVYAYHILQAEAQEAGIEE
jgi:GH15 family glucan-1,4-alpha-glucosidase